MTPCPKELLTQILNAPHIRTDFENDISKFYPYASATDIETAYAFLVHLLGGDRPLEKYYGELVEATCQCYDPHDTDRLWSLIGKSLFPFADFTLEY